MITSRAFQPPDAENQLGVHGNAIAYRQITCTQEQAGGYGYEYN